MSGGRLAHLKRAIEARLPAPMAAPETSRLKRLRITLIVELAAMAVLTTAWEPLIRLGAQLPAAFLWLTLALSTVVIGLRWLITKLKADKAWAERERGE